jgi:hypothetical protein
MEPQWLYYSEVADILSISEDDVKQLIKDERLVSVGNGRARRVTRHSLKLYRALYEHLPPPAPSALPRMCENESCKCKLAYLKS